MTVIREHNPDTESWEIVLIGAPGHGLEITGYDTWANISARPSPLDGEVWILSADDPAAPDGGNKGEGILRSAGAWYNLGPVLQGPTGPTGPPGADGVGTPIGEQTFTFPASLALGSGGGYIGLQLTAAAGDTLMDPPIALSRPVGWGGPDPLPVLAFKTTGLYMVQGMLNLSPGALPDQGITGITAITRTGGAVGGNVRGGINAQGYVPGPTMLDSFAQFSTMLWVTNIDAALRFSIKVNVAGLSTWSTPGTLSILRVR